ncbi:MAG: PorV/PorQ family protein [candidate division WOR-3 bacterium]|nr:PorV/PorQ family protein [candidate division WOR-3 bacterium]
MSTREGLVWRCALLWVAAATSLAGGVGLPGSAFLKLGAGVRPAALGDAYCAVAGDAMSAYWNPAGLGRLRLNDISFTHNIWIAGMSHEDIRIGWHMPAGSIGIGLTYLNYGSISKYDASGFYIGEFTPYDAALTVAYGIVPGGMPVAAGVSIKGIMQRIDDRSAGGIAFDAGLHWQVDDWLFAGAALSNVGPDVRFVNGASPLPLTFRSGLFCVVPGSVLLLSGELDFVKGQRISAGGGAELNLVWIRPRIGYRAGSGTLASGVSAGVGLFNGSFRVDYAVVPFAVLGYTHRIGMTICF